MRGPAIETAVPIRCPIQRNILSNNNGPGRYQPGSVHVFSPLYFSEVYSSTGDHCLHLVASLAQQGRPRANTLSVWQRSEKTLISWRKIARERVFRIDCGVCCLRRSISARRAFRRGPLCLNEFCLPEWLPPGEPIETIVQFDAFLGFVSSQRFVKTIAHPDAALLTLLRTHLSKKPNAQQMYVSSLLEAEAANPQRRTRQTRRALRRRHAPGPPSRRFSTRPGAASRPPPRDRQARCS